MIIIQIIIVVIIIVINATSRMKEEVADNSGSLSDAGRGRTRLVATCLLTHLPTICLQCHCCHHHHYQHLPSSFSSHCCHIVIIIVIVKIAIYIIIAIDVLLLSESILAPFCHCRTEVGLPHITDLVGNWTLWTQNIDNHRQGLEKDDILCYSALCFW